MNLILAATHVVNTPDVNVHVPTGIKDALRPIVTSRPLLVVAILFILLAISASPKVFWVVRVAALLFAFSAIAGWIDQSGIALAAAGGKQENVNTGALTAVVVGGGYLFMRVVPGMRRKPAQKPDEGVAAALKALTGGGPSRDRRRGRRGR